MKIKCYSEQSGSLPDNRFFVCFWNHVGFCSDPFGISSLDPDVRDKRDPDNMDQFSVDL